jgi:hypothetical protein
LVLTAAILFTRIDPTRELGTGHAAQAG